MEKEKPSLREKGKEKERKGTHTLRTMTKKTQKTTALIPPPPPAIYVFEILNKPGGLTYGG